MKDKFSQQSEAYAQFRPSYPPELVDFICRFAKNTDTCWDCGTGSGQLAVQLAEVFDQVEATDMSNAQLEKAPHRPNIHYSCQKAERTTFQSDQFDLVTVAQAIHWFDFDSFYDEVHRTLKPGGKIAIIGYGLIKINSEIDPIVNHFYSDILGSYWDEERKYVDGKYLEIPFPFEEERDLPTFHIAKDIYLNQFIGYLESWSAVVRYHREVGSNPLDLVRPQLKEFWGDSRRKITHEIFLRMGTLPVS